MTTSLASGKLSECLFQSCEGRTLRPFNFISTFTHMIALTTCKKYESRFYAPKYANLELFRFLQVWPCEPQLAELQNFLFTTSSWILLHCFLRANTRLFCSLKHIQSIFILQSPLKRLKKKFQGRRSHSKMSHLPRSSLHFHFELNVKIRHNLRSNATVWKLTHRKT